MATIIKIAFMMEVIVVDLWLTRYFARIVYPKILLFKFLDLILKFLRNHFITVSFSCVCQFYFESFIITYLKKDKSLINEKNRGNGKIVSLILKNHKDASLHRSPLHKQMVNLWPGWNTKSVTLVQPPIFGTGSSSPALLVQTWRLSQPLCQP